MSVAAMTRHAVASPVDEQAYLDALNVCFPGWGGRAMFDWCFVRESAGLRADLMWLCADGRPVAGTANTYRHLRLANGQTVRAAIMTGSWTLPAARGLGAFTRLIHESRELAAERQAGLLLAFVTLGNASFGRLREAGAALFPTSYGRSTEPPRVDVDGAGWTDLPLDAVDVDGGWWRHDDDGGAVRYSYVAEEWRDQFMRRPSDVAYVSGADRWRALVERTPSFDRVLSLAIAPGLDVEPCRDQAIRALSARASSAGRRLFCFTSGAHEAGRLAALGFEIVDGALTALIANDAVLSAALAIHPATPAASAHALADPASPWGLGRWSLQNGDRM